MMDKTSAGICSDCSAPSHRQSTRYARTDYWRTTTQDVSIEVKDSDPGIAIEHRDKVFNRFYRIDEARSRETGGSGLGLAIAKWGAQTHNGELELDCTANTWLYFSPDFASAQWRSASKCQLRLKIPRSAG
jgi:K+-sensing histidine kinase KdpD